MFSIVVNICGYLTKLNQQTAKRKPLVRPNPVSSSFAYISALADSIDNLWEKEKFFGLVKKNGYIFNISYSITSIDSSSIPPPELRRIESLLKKRNCFCFQSKNSMKKNYQ